MGELTLALLYFRYLLKITHIIINRLIEIEENVDFRAKSDRNRLFFQYIYFK